MVILLPQCRNCELYHESERTLLCDERRSL